jgi:UPF0716 protein FxsA
MRLLFLFTVIPALELYLLLRIGAAFGAVDTFLLIVVTGILGASLARREGFSLIQRLAQEAEAGFPTGNSVVEGLLILGGGLLLLTPGVLTDLVGLACVAPFSRKPLARMLKAWLMTHATFQDGSIKMGSLRTRPTPAQKEGDPFRHPRA